MQLKPGDVVRRTHTSPINAEIATTDDMGTVVRVVNDQRAVVVYLWRLRKEVGWLTQYVEKVDADGD